MSRQGIRGLKTRVGQECSISRGRCTCPRRESQGYEWGRSRGVAPRVRAAKSSEFGEGKL